MQVFILMALVLITTSCSSVMKRSAQSGYADKEMAHQAEKNELQGPETMKIAAEMGYSPYDSLSGDQWEAIMKRRRLRQLESRLGSSREREQYSKVLPYFQDDDEKIAFLSIPSLEGRQAWITQSGLWKRAQTQNPEMQELVTAGDIAVGMPMDYVKRSWGEPQSVEVSGNPIYKNERWKYLRYVSTQDGYKQEKRTVYFESGRVVGWETN